MNAEPPAVPWAYGRYRVVIQRRVTEEEQISVEAYEETQDAATATFDRFMAAMRRHMLTHNKRIVMAQRQRLVALERQIEDRAEELRAVEERLERQREEATCEPAAARSSMPPSSGSATRPPPSSTPHASA